MTHTSLILISLVFAALWYTGRRPANTKGKPATLIDRNAYLLLLGAAVALAFLWQ